MFVLKAVRYALFDVIADAGISIDIAGIPTAVTVEKNPPSGGWLPDDALPGVYLFMRREVIEPEARRVDLRTITANVILQARGGRLDVVDQVDDMQEAIEVLIASDPTLGGKVRQIRLTDSEIQLERGAVVFAARRLTFEIKASVERSAPTIV